MENLLSLWKYFATVTLDGNAQNVWLYTLPEDIFDAAFALGTYIAGILFGG